LVDVALFRGIPWWRAHRVRSCAPSSLPRRGSLIRPPSSRSLSCPAPPNATRR